MTITIVNAPTWSIGDELTIAQVNQLDANGTYALDKRAGQTDTLSSVVSLAGTGRIVTTVATGANADTTYLVSGANLDIRVTSAVTANRAYTLSATNAVTGDVITVFAESSFVTYEVTIKDQAAATLYTLGNLDSSDGTWAQFMYVGGWRLYRGGQGSRIRTQAFTTNGTWVCPKGVTKVHLLGVGGGGGGGAGGGQTTSYPCSGGGGGGAQLGSLYVTTTPGTSYTVTVGTGGAGGAGSGTANGAAGSDGADTTFGALVSFYGGGGGAGGGTVNYFAVGGRSMRNGAVLVTSNSLGARPLSGEGGWGTGDAAVAATTTYRTGGASAITQGGNPGGDNTLRRGGGGGGASGYAGNVPGTGGGSNDFVTTVPGVAGTLGAGGGGGGPGDGSGAAGGAGGAGGNGAVIVTWVK